jgi:serine/threonine-protein kinase
MNERFGGYEILEFLGKGTSATVHRARQISLNRIVALKIHSPAGEDCSDWEARIQREMSIVTELRHPNLVRILDCGAVEGRPYFAMELVEGGTLQELMQGNTAFPWPLALAIGSRLFLALAYLHSQNVLHRDIKPSNILISREGAVKVADFGLCRDLNSTVLTRSGILVGTLLYMAPELILGELHSPSTDIWAVGCVLYQLLTGRYHHQVESLPRLAEQLLSDCIVPPDRLIAGIPREVSQLVENILTMDTSLRPSNAAALGQQIDELLATCGGTSWEQVLVQENFTAAALAQMVSPSRLSHSTVRIRPPGAQQAPSPEVPRVVELAPSPSSGSGKRPVLLLIFLVLCVLVGVRLSGGGHEQSLRVIRVPPGERSSHLRPSASRIPLRPEALEAEGRVATLQVHSWHKAYLEAQTYLRGLARTRRLQADTLGTNMVFAFVKGLRETTMARQEDMQELEVRGHLDGMNSTRGPNAYLRELADLIDSVVELGDAVFLTPLPPSGLRAFEEAVGKLLEQCRFWNAPRDGERLRSKIDQWNSRFPEHWLGEMLKSRAARSNRAPVPERLHRLAALRLFERMMEADPVGCDPGVGLEYWYSYLQDLLTILDAARDQSIYQQMLGVERTAWESWRGAIPDLQRRHNAFSEECAAWLARADARAARGRAIPGKR